MGARYGPFVCTAFVLKEALKGSVGRIVIVQFIVMVLAAAGCLLVDIVAAYSALLGGLVCVVPAVYAAARFHCKTSKEGTGLTPILLGELGKLVFCVALFLAVFVLVEPLNALSFFGTFIGLQLIYIAVPVLGVNRLRSQQG
jgi:ATP synthase protein I